MNTELITTAWPIRLAQDLLAAKDSFTITALSCLAPNRLGCTPYHLLWQAIIDSPVPSASKLIILQAPHPATMATRNNAGAAAALAKHDIRTRLVSTRNLLHAKTAVIDATISWIGSGNLTAAAANHNHEAWIRAASPALAASLAKFHAQLQY